MSARTWIAVALLFGACSGGAGGDDDDGPATDAPVDDAIPDARVIDAPVGNNAGFVTPTAVTKANMYSGGAWSEIGDADWSCLGTPSLDQPSTGTIALSGRITDFQTGNGVGAATITAWSTSPSAVVGTATSNNDPPTRGNYTMTLGMLPSGTRRYGFTLAAANYVTTRILHEYYPPGAAATDGLVMISQPTALALPAFIGVERDQTKAMYIGTMLDCQRRPVSNAVAAISSLPAVYQDAGGITFYFSAGSSSLPVRHTVEPVMNNDGLFVVLNAPPGATHRVQVWGFKDAAGLSSGTLTLLGELLAPSVADDAVTMTLAPRRI